MARQHIEVDEYPCPHCHALLEPPGLRWNGWVICPSCRHPGLPPEPIGISRRLKSRRQAMLKTIARNEPAVDPRPNLDETGIRFEQTPPRPRSSGHSSASRLIILTGLIVSLFLLLVAYLDRSARKSSIFGFLTVLFFLLLLRLPKKS